MGKLVKFLLRTSRNGILGLVVCIGVIFSRVSGIVPSVDWDAHCENAQCGTHVGTVQALT